MSGVPIAERTKLSWLLMRRGFRSLLRRLNPRRLWRWRIFPAKTDRLVIAPQDLRTADATRAAEIYSGRFAFAGKVVLCDRRSPFQMTSPSEDWAVQLLGFGWLRHLRAAESNIARANARALVDEWISLQGAWHTLAWRSDVLSRRVISWLCQAPLVLNDADVQFYRRFLRSLSRQVRHLRRGFGDAREGFPRLQAAIALTYAGLCMAAQTRHAKAAAQRLSDELENQILPDGGHVSRNPGILIELLLDLLPLRQAFGSRNLQPPEAMLNAIDRMMPMLRFFRHADGNFALFNGMGPTPSDQLATVLAYDDARGTPVSNAPHSGYQRLALKDMLLIVDTGRLPPLNISQDAHASCLAFEFSSGIQRIVVNCGLPANNRDSWRQLGRATAAHSTVSLNDVSSCLFRETGPFRKLIGIPALGGPRQIKIAREDHSEAVLLRASHDGYASRFGIIHERALMLSENGKKLQGEEVFLPAHGDSLPPGTEDHFAVRFHLHPSVKANRLSDGHGVMLVLPSREVWTFDAHEDVAELEESVYLAGPEGPRRAVQIVIYGQARQAPRVHWTFSHVTPAQAASRRHQNAAQEPELPL